MTLFVFNAVPAFAAITGLDTVTLADNDTTGPGIDGRDFTVTWDVAAATGGENLMGYGVYLIKTSDPDLIEGDLESAIGAGESIPLEFTTFTAPQSVTTDANAATIVAGDYKACVAAQVFPSGSKVTCSTAVTITSDVVADTNPPIIATVPVNTAINGVAATFNLEVIDDQTPGADFYTDTDTDSYMKLYYGADISSSEALVICESASGDANSKGIGKCVTPNVDGFKSSDKFEYRLEASDNEGNVRYFCALPENLAVSAAACKAAPFVVNTIAAGSRTISGRVTNVSSESAEIGMYVFAGGFAIASTTTDGLGDYTLTGLPNNTPVEVIVTKQDICAKDKQVFLQTSNVTGANFNVTSGACSFAPPVHPVFSDPPAGSNHVPLDKTIKIGFNQPLDSVSVQGQMPGNTYLTSDDGTTKIASTVSYCPTKTDSGNCSVLFPGDNNVVVIDPSSNLTANTFYTLVMTEKVLSESNQSIEGNRPGGGYQLGFSTGGGAITDSAENFGGGGLNMPPMVSSVTPPPGVSAYTNSKILLKFNEPMDTSTVTTSTVKLKQGVTDVTIGVAIDNTTKQDVVITPSSPLTAGLEYEVQVLGGAANLNGAKLLPPDSVANVAFRSSFPVKAADTGNITVFPMLTSGSTDVGVNTGAFEFGFSKPINPLTVTSSNITVSRGGTAVAASVQYHPAGNTVFVIPDSRLLPNTNYSIQFSTSIQSTTALTFASAQTISYTTGASDTTAPSLKEANCNEFECSIIFNEPMNNDTQVDAAYAASVLKLANYTLTKETSIGSGTFTSDVLSGSSATLSYDAVANKVILSGLPTAEADRGKKFLLTVNAAVTDLAGTAIVTASSANMRKGIIKNSSTDIIGKDLGMFAGAFNGDGGGGFTAGTEFNPGDFGGFTPDQAIFGGAAHAFPFNPMAGQDSNVFQVGFNPGVVLADEDQIVLTYPSGTIVTNATSDSYSPLNNDFNQQHGSGTITFDTTFGGGDGVLPDATDRTVTIALDVTGTPGANDQYMIDLSGIQNPAIPKGPDSGGVTLGIKVIRAGDVLVTKTSMPYFISAGGSNTINLKVAAGNSSGVAGADGGVFLYGGGPAGPLDKQLTLTDGLITDAGSADVTAAAVVFSNLVDGCYFFKTDSFVALGGVDYFGQMRPEPICVNGGQTKSETIVLGSADAAGASVTATIKLVDQNGDPFNFGGADIDIFAGGPGSFVTKTLSNVTTANSGGYPIKLGDEGFWHLGVGPALSKSSTGSKPIALTGTPPPPAEIKVSDLSGTPTIAAGSRTPQNVSINGATKTITFTFKSANIPITGVIKDGSGNGLSNINVFAHSQGIGATANATTDSTGAFTINVGQTGSYEIGAYKEGLPSKFKQIDVRPDGADAGSDPDIYFDGKQITDANPLVMKLKKSDYTISGKVLDADSEAIAYAPVFALDANGNNVGGMTDSSGAYSLFVDAGTWTVESAMPPDKSGDICGTFSKEVVVTTASLSSQNITPTTGTCVTLSGVLAIDGTNLANAPVMIEEWDTVNNKPVFGGEFKMTTTDADGAYEAAVLAGGSKKYRVNTFTPENGEISTITPSAVTTNTTLSLAKTTGNITFAFTGGTDTMTAFIDIKNTDDKFVRRGTSADDLSTSTVIAAPILDGGDDTYDYFVDVAGIGKFTGTATTGATTTIDLSGTTVVAMTGAITDENGVVLPGALVTAVEATTGIVQSTIADTSGNYAMNLKAGDYSISTSIAGYMPAVTSSDVTLTADPVTQNFNDTASNGLALADSVITGTINEADGSTPVEQGYVSATSADGKTVSAPIDTDGTYSLPVNDGVWTIKATAPRNAKTTLETTVTVSGSDVPNSDVTLTADATNVTKTATRSMSSSGGTSVNDDDNTDINIVIPAGAIGGGSGNATLSLEKTADAPESQSFAPLGNTLYSVGATDSSDVEIKTLSGNMDICINYADNVDQLPSGSTEADLQLTYRSPERDEYIPVEGGFTIDPANDTACGKVPHLTDFAVVVASSPVVVVEESSPSPSPSPSPSGGGGGGGGVGGGGSSSSSSSNSSVAKVTTISDLTTVIVSETVVAEVSTSQTGVTGDGATLQAADEKIAAVVLTDNLKVTDAEGNAYTGKITAPTKVTLEAAAPASHSQVSDVYEVGSADASLKFNTKVTLLIPVKSGTDLDAKLAAYYYSDSTKEWLLAGDGGKLKKTAEGELVMEVMVDHFTKFAVMKDDTVVVEVIKLKAGEFSDTVSHWAKEHIVDLVGKDILKGYADGTFGPDKNVTRAEFTKVVLEAFDVAVLTETEVKAMPADFSDVAVGQWYARYVKAAKENGIVNGYSGNKFKPNATITRAEAMKVLLGAAGIDVSKEAVTDEFNDVSSKAWFGQYVSYAAKNKIVSGYGEGKFGPENNLKRGEVAKIVSLMLKMDLVGGDFVEYVLDLAL